MHPELIRIPGIDWPVHTYGALIVIGFLLALQIAYRQALRVGKYHNDILDFGFWALLGGMIGARVVFIAVEWRSYLIDKPFTELGKTGIRIPSILAFWQGGLVFWGAILGGFIAFLLFARKRNLPKLELADCLFLGVPIAQAFGRLGCTAAGCCYGKALYHLDNIGQVIKDFPYTLQFPPTSIAYSNLYHEGNYATKDLMNKIGSTVPLFPSQLAESFGCVAIFLVLMVAFRLKRFHGQVFLTYAIMYSILRSFLEQFRGDIDRGFIFDGMLSTSQFISVLVVSASLITIAILLSKKPPAFSSAK